MILCLDDAVCRVEQAQAVLSMWLETNTTDDMESGVIGAVITLLDGVPEVTSKSYCEVSE